MHARRRYPAHEDRVQLNIPDDSDKSHSKPYYNPPIEQSRQREDVRFLNSSSVDLDEEIFPFMTEKDIPNVMTSRDRTQEFGAAIRLLAGGAISRASNVRDAKKAQALQSYSQFMQSARIISKNISSTYSKLEKLALLAKKKSLFDDRPAEIQELTYIIKGDLGSLNQQIARLGELPRGQKHIHKHSSSVVLGLQSRLASMSTHFKQVLEVRSENLKHQNSRREHFTKGLPPVKGSTSLLEEEHVSIEMDGIVPAENQNRLHQRQQMALRDESDVYLAERAETMHNIESTIVELGGIFQQLAHMVKEQDETISRIDTNVQDAELNIEAAHSQILKYFQSITNNRMLMFKIFGVLIFFFIFFVVFLA